MRTASIFCTALVCLQLVPQESTAKKAVPSPEVVAMALSPDGDTLALVERTHNVRLWQVSTQKDLRSFPIGGTRESYVTMCEFSRDGKSLVIAGSGRLEVWDVATGKLRMSYKNEVKTLVARLVMRNGAFERVEEFVMKPDDVRAARFSADGKTLYSSGKDNAIKIWDVEGGKETGKFVGHGDPATHLAISANGKVMASGSFHREVKVWDLERKKEIAAFANGGRSTYGVAISADGKQVVSSSGTEALLWDVANKNLIRRFPAKANMSPVAFSPDEKLVIGQAINYYVWDAKTGEQLATFEYCPTFGITITPDGRKLLACDIKGNVRVHELPKP